MIEKGKRRKDFYSINEIIEETRNCKDIKSPTANDVLEYLLGDSDNWCGSDFVVYKYEAITARSLVQRINTIWFYPLFILTVPFQYLIHGNVGINRNSRIGKIVNWLVKFD